MGRYRLGIARTQQRRAPPMFSNILLTVDGCEASLEAARQGIALAQHLKARVTVVVVTFPGQRTSPVNWPWSFRTLSSPRLITSKKRHSKAVRLLDEVEAHARRADVTVKGVRARTVTHSTGPSIVASRNASPVHVRCCFPSQA